MSEETAAAYQAARARFLIVLHEAPGVLRVRGRNALDFLNRMSTNAMEDLAPGRVRGTVLTTAIGRTVDVVDALCRSAEVLLLTSPGRAEDVRSWLNRYIFFNDDVQIEAAAGGETYWGIYGPQAPAEMTRFGVPLPTAPEAFTEDGDARVWAVERPVPGFRALAGPEATARARALWEDSGDDPAARSAYEAIRIEQGLPTPGHEIDEQVIPLEVGLWDRVSFSKGCYIGQEVIARMESRNRVARTLIGVRLERLEQPVQEVLLDHQPIGRMTSTAVSPRFGPIGLALVRHSTAEGGRLEVTLTPAGSAGVLEPLPFDQRPD